LKSLLANLVSEDVVMLSRVKAPCAVSVIVTFAPD